MSSEFDEIFALDVADMTQEYLGQSGVYYRTRAAATWTELTSCVVGDERTFEIEDNGTRKWQTSREIQIGVDDRQGNYSGIASPKKGAEIRIGDETVYTIQAVAAAGQDGATILTLARSTARSQGRENIHRNR